MVRRASVFVGASDLSQLPFVAKHFGQEEQNTLIGGIVERYREDVRDVS